MSGQSELTVKSAFIFILMILLLILTLPFNTLAQEKTEDVVYLKNGSIIRGTIIEQIPNKSIRIQTRDGSIFFYEMDEIEKITKEPRISVKSFGKPLGKSAFYFNPLGFLQFGPTLGAEFGIVSNTFFDVHLRYSALGVVYQALESDGFEDEVSFGSMAFGAGFKQFIDNPYLPNRFYFGGFIEYGWGGSRGDLDTEWEWEAEDAYIVFLTNFGHRWRFPSRIFVNFGLFAGIVKMTKDEWWETKNPDEVFKDDLAIYFFGMLEFSVGREMGD